MPAKPRRPRKHATPAGNAPVTLQGSVEATQGETATNGSGEKSAPLVHLTAEQEKDLRNADILARLGRGEPYRKIVEECGVAFATVSRIAQSQADLEVGAIAKLMQSKALRMLELWEEAAESGAKAGKHAPAKEYLTHAKALEPVSSDAQHGAKVAILIGMPGSPVTHEVMQVIDTQQVSGKD